MSKHAFLTTLESVIRERAKDGNASSYTARLLAEGPARVAQKLGEEGVEAALATVAGEASELRNEAADLVYHLLVALHLRGLTLADVCDELEARHTP